jgi:uncharacterized protein YjbI with pentapeptide repeats
MRIAATFVLALGLGLSAHAQTPAPAPTPTASGPAAPSATATAGQSAEKVTRLCAKVTFDSEMSLAEIALAKQCLEAVKVQQENTKLELESARLKLENEKANRPPDILSVFLGMGSMIAAFFALIGALIGYYSKSAAERSYAILQARHAKEDYERKTIAERNARREERALSLLDTLSGDSPAKRSFAVAGLLSNIAANTEDERQETEMVISALFARVRDAALTLGESKYIADELGKFFKTRSANYKLADFNLQQARLLKAYWAKLDASNADFFEADLSGSSLRGANLSNAVFLGANLSGVQMAEASLAGADLRGANLKGALLADAKGVEAAKMDATTLADAATTWPPGFDPAARGVKIG